MKPKKYQSKKSEDGFTLIIAATFLTVVYFLGMGMMNYAVSESKVAKNFETSVSAMQMAEAGIQKAFYCLNADSGSNCGGSYGDLYNGESQISFGDGFMEITISEDGDNKEIQVVAQDTTGQTSTIIVNAAQPISTITDTQFDFAIMATGSITIDNNAEISNGPLYSEVDVVCGNNAEIDGDVIISKVNGKLDNCEVSGSAYADRIEDSDIEGDCYYDSSWVRSSCDGTKYPNQDTPASVSMPDIDVDFWQQEAVAGGIITGNYYPPDNSTLGPAKIEGNLILSNNRDVTLLGSLWVTGNITMNNNSSFTLDSSFTDKGSIVMADGNISISNNAQISGTGQSGSYLLFYTPSTSNPAISISNNAGAGLYFAPNGGIRVSNNAGAVAVAGKHITINNGAEIIYDNFGLPNELELLIISENQDGWTPVRGTWREL